MSRNILSYHPWVGRDSALHFPMPKALNLVPPRKRATLIYSTHKKITPDAIPITFAFRGNGIFDPEVGLGGQQPRGHDEYALLYGKYYVVKSAISVAVKNLAGSQDPFAICVYPYSDVTGDMPEPTLASDPNNWYAQDRVKVVYPSGNDSSTDTNLIRYSCTSKQALGKGHDRNDVTALVANDPSLQWYWKTTTQRLVDATAPSAQEIFLVITITYDVIFSEPDNFAES